MKLSVSAARSYARSISIGSGCAIRGGERVAVDEIAAVRGQRDAVARLGVGRARLRVLPGDAADADHGRARAVDQHERHLQQDLQLRRDRIGLAVVEALGAIAAVEQERVAAVPRARARLRSCSTSHDVTSGGRRPISSTTRASATGSRYRPAAPRVVLASSKASSRSRSSDTVRSPPTPAPRVR